MKTAGTDNNIEETISEITLQLGFRHIGFLIGAGMSIDSGGIPGKEVAKGLVQRSFLKRFAGNLPPEIRESLQTIIQQYPLEVLAEAARSQLSFKDKSLIDFLKNTIFPDGEHTHDGHNYFAQLIHQNTIQMVFTTNWDCLIEEALSNSARTITEDKFHDLDKAINDGDIAVLHLHGTFDDNPIICERDLMDPSRPLFQIFLSEMLSKVFVFVGYSFSDPNIRALYYRAKNILIDARAALEKKTYIVYPAANDVEISVATAIWNERDAVYIPLTAKEFFERLRAQASEAIVTKLIDKIQTRLGIDGDAIRSKMVEILKVFPGFGSKVQVLNYMDEITRGGIN